LDRLRVNSLRKGNDCMNITSDHDRHAFVDEARDAVYRAIFSRRDVRGQFLPAPVPDTVLARLLNAAHHAPSVGFMQPLELPCVARRRSKAPSACRVRAGPMPRRRKCFPNPSGTPTALSSSKAFARRRSASASTDRRARCGPVVIGRTHMKIMDLYSSVRRAEPLAAARAEGLGVGWVSIFDPAQRCARLSAS
jgi:5,6-dimethylbenzimidazole synthase